MVSRIQFIVLLGVVFAGLDVILTSTASAQDARGSASDSERHHGGHHGWSGSPGGGSGDHGGDRGRSWSGRGDDRSSGSSSQSSSSSSAAKSASSTSSSSKSSTDTKSAAPSAPPTAAEIAVKTRKWATDLVMENDKNKNGFLDGDELKSIKVKPEAITKDGVVTVDSLVAASTPSSTQAPAAATASPSSSSSTTKSDSDSSKRVLVGSAGGLAASSKDGDKRHSYRFTPADEKLPSGLPPWFKDKDKNGDGQIEMSEYARTWTNSTAADFQRYDLNGDGVITAKEAASKPAPKGG